MATAAVSGAIGVVSTVASISAQNKQAKLQQKSAEVNKYAAEVNYESQKQALQQQKEYSRQQQQLAETTYAAQDAQARMSLKENELKGLMGNAEQVFANKQQKVQAESQYNEALNAANQQEFAVNERARQQQGQAELASQQANEQTTQQLRGVMDALAKGDTTRAALLVAQNANGQDDSITSAVNANDTENLVNSLRAKVEAGRFTEVDLQQLAYNHEVVYAMRELGLSDVLNQRTTAQNARDYANTVTDLNSSNIDYAGKQNDVANRLALSTLDASKRLYDQQTNINKTFNELGYQTQENNLSVSNASQINAANTQIASSKPNGLLSALAVGGSLFNAAAPYLQKPWSPPNTRVPVTRRPDVYDTENQGLYYDRG